MWDQDFSGLVDMLDSLRAEGVSDIRAYFESRPEALAGALARVEVRNVNNYAVDLFEAENRDALLGALGATFLPETQPVFLDEIVALWEGRRSFESEATARTLKGRRLNILISIAWEGARAERSLVSILDISRQKASEGRFLRLNRIGRMLAGELDLERIVQAVTDAATELSGASFGAFFYNVTDAQGESFVLFALSGAPRSAFEKFGLPRNTAVFDPTFRGTGIVRSDDIRKDPRYGKNYPHHGMPKGHLPVVSYLAVPVVSRSGEVHGGLFFGHDQPGVFTAESEEIVAGIAAHAAIAIDNARLHKATVFEIEERRRAEHSQRHLASIIESSDDAIASKDLNGTIISWNAGAERLFGYPAAEIIGKPVTVLIPDDHLDEEPGIIERIRRGERIDHYETIRRRRDGTLIDVSLSVSPVMDAEGRVVAASKIARDISERRRAETSLLQRAEEQAALYQFTDELYRAEGLATVYEAALDAIQRALSCRRASILLFDSHDVMRFVAWRGLSDGYRQAVDGHSPWTADARDARPITIEDVAASALPEPLMTTIGRESIGALAFIPLESRGRVIGKFMTYYEGPHRFTANEIELAVTIARQLSFAIERKHSEAQRDLLVAELSHRVKNTLSTVISIAQQSFARSASADDARSSFQARIRALAQTHGRLAEANWAGVSLETLILDVLAPYENDGNLTVVGPAVSLDPRTALTLGMAIHELATNAAKYGALSVKGGSVRVTWGIDADRRLRLKWSEAGGPKTAPPTRTGFGRLLLERALASDLKGEVTMDFAESGLDCAIALPLADAAPAD